MKKLTFRDHVRIASTLWYVGAAITIVGGYLSEPLQPNWIFWIGIAIFLGSTIYRVLMVKCPHCGSSLLGSRLLPKYCPDCGKKLD